jgi:hypothetical protein
MQFLPTTHSRKPDSTAGALLAACDDGRTEAIMLTHGFTTAQMVELVRACLSDLYPRNLDRLAAGNRAFTLFAREPQGGKRSPTWRGDA